MDGSAISRLLKFYPQLSWDRNLADGLDIAASRLQEFVEEGRNTRQAVGTGFGDVKLSGKRTT